MPEGVREVTGRRLARLGRAGPRRCSPTAAVIGREFDFDVLEEVGPLRGDELVAALEEAVAARVLREDAERVGRYAFGHALMRATLYDGLSALRRARLHSRVGEALIARRGAQLDPHLGQLAHHFALAAPVERPERAVDFALAAGRRADRLLAWEEAAGHYAAALRARELAGAPEDRLRCELLLALGASQERAGAPEMRATFAARRRRRRARSATRRCSGAPRSATPAAGRSSGAWRRTWRRCSRRRSARSAPRTRRCARGCSPGSRWSSTTRATPTGGSRCRRRRSRWRAGSATRSRSPICLDARHYALWRPETVQERLEVASELRRIAEAVGDHELELEGAGWTVVDLLELGDVAGADIQIAAASRLAAALHRPLYEWWTSLFRCARAQLDGRFDEAERLAGETLAIGRRGQAENAVHVYAQAMFNIRREQGRLAEVEEAVRGFIAKYPAVPAWRCTLALLHLELGREDAARAEFEALAARGLRHAPARRQVADRDHAAGRGLRPGRRRRARGRAVRGARALRGAQRRRGAGGDVQRLGVAAARGARRASRASGRGRSGTSPTRSRCTWRWARARSRRGRRWRGRRWSCARGRPEAARERLEAALASPTSWGWSRSARGCGRLLVSAGERQRRR